MTSQERHEARYQRRKSKREQKNIERAEKYAEFRNIFSLEKLEAGYKNVAKPSGNKTSTQTWMANLAVNARKEQIELYNGTWKSRGFNYFTIKERGKWRNIQSTHISEKGIQNCFVNNCFIPLIEPHLIYDNGASLKGKGTSFSIDRFVEHLRYHIRKHGVKGGIYFFDFSNFFANINNDILFNKADPLIMEEAAKKIYSVFTCAFGSGLGLGSPISQISALFYPSVADHWLKDGIGIKGYGRHMDDGYIICDDIQKLKKIAERFEKKCEELGIVMNRKKCRIIRLKANFVFLKTRFFITPSGKIIKRMSREKCRMERKRLRKFCAFYRLGVMKEKEIYLNFHSWVMSQPIHYTFHALLNMIRYYNELFPNFERYRPLKTNMRKAIKKNSQMSLAVYQNNTTG